MFFEKNKFFFDKENSNLMNQNEIVDRFEEHFHLITSSAIENLEDLQYFLPHPLKNKWTFWYLAHDRTKEWKENQKNVYSFDTVENFWSFYNNIEEIGNLKVGTDYSLFKDGIQPMWEDPLNSKGARLIIKFKGLFRKNLNEYWLETLLSLIGLSFGDLSDLVNGAAVSRRPKFDKLAIWLSDYSNLNSITTIGDILKERLSLDDSIKIEFEVNSASMDSMEPQFTLLPF